MGVGTSAREKIFFAPDLVEYKCCFYGSPEKIGIASLIESLMSSVETYPGTIYACLPLIMLLMRLINFGLYIRIWVKEK